MIKKKILILPLLTRIANIEVQIAKLDSEAWPGLLDPERDRLILINEKEELLKELQYVGPRQRLEPNDAEKLETEKKRLERDLQAARDNQSKALTERWVELSSGRTTTLHPEEQHVDIKESDRTGEQLMTSELCRLQTATPNLPPLSPPPIKQNSPCSSSGQTLPELCLCLVSSSRNLRPRHKEDLL